MKQDYRRRFENTVIVFFLIFVFLILITGTIDMIRSCSIEHAWVSNTQVDAVTGYAQLMQEPARK
jgi:hypothetical protein